MIAYIIRRQIEVVIVLFGVSSMIFILLHLRPGGPCGTSIGGQLDGRLNCVDYFQLDTPIVDQYGTFLGNYLHGNLGTSLESGGGSVLTIMQDHLPATILLITSAFIVQQLLALPLGILAAVRRYSVFDSVFSVLSYVFLSIPPFIMGLALMWVIGVDLDWFPAVRASDETLPVLGTGAWFALLPHAPSLLLGDMVRHLVLPMTTLAVIGIALDSRFMRASMLQVLEEDYIRTAKAKGLTRRSIIFKHAFRNALPPIITNLALYLPSLLGSAMVVETVFTYTGIGFTFTQAIHGGNTTVVQAVFLVSTLAVLFGNLVADVAYAVADPRVRYD